MPASTFNPFRVAGRKTTVLELLEIIAISTTLASLRLPGGYGNPPCQTKIFEP